MVYGIYIIVFGIFGSEWHGGVQTGSCGWCPVQGLDVGNLRGVAGICKTMTWYCSLTYFTIGAITKEIEGSNGTEAENI